MLIAITATRQDKLTRTALMMIMMMSPNGQQISGRPAFYIMHVHFNGFYKSRLSRAQAVIEAKSKDL
jgi:DNA-binding MurR/RpiR family transcriptional regulator